ncbi:hypothetical protein BDW22DRAFT_1361994 [Trametopsis cervina]|nr:hypothetical protein BDW22DRAFT_1361994 [Trametopsis cervina]
MAVTPWCFGRGLPRTHVQSLSRGIGIKSICASCLFPSALRNFLRLADTGNFRNMASKYITFVDYPGQPLGGTIVPQRLYTASSPYHRRESIRFNHGGRMGVGLQDALRQRAEDMPDADERPETTTSSSKITLRINWQGYADFSCNINAREHSQRGESILKRKLAFCVAQVVYQFYQRATPSQGDQDVHYAGWELANIPFERLRLLELRHVSPGSWQPVLLFQT